MRLNSSLFLSISKSGFWNSALNRPSASPPLSSSFAASSAFTSGFLRFSVMRRSLRSFAFCRFFSFWYSSYMLGFATIFARWYSLLSMKYPCMYARSASVPIRFSRPSSLSSARVTYSQHAPSHPTNL